VPAQVEPVADAPAVEVAAAAPVSQPVPAVAVEKPAELHWATEWEAVAATRATPSAPVSLHTAAAAAIDAVFGTSPAAAAWTAAPADLQPEPHPAPFAVSAPTAPAPPAPALTALDRPAPPAQREMATPLAYEAARAVPQSGPAVPTAPAPAVTAPPAPVAVPAVAVVPPRPAPPATSLPTMPPPPGPPPRTTSVPSSARQLLERAIRTAPTAPVQHRSTVRLGFADASVIDLRPDDPIAKALHTVADALIGRESQRPS
jgi:hypothetical protein